MPSAKPEPESEPRFPLKELRLVRSDIVRYARMFPPGPERNQQRQIGLSLRRLFKNQQWLDAHTVDDVS
jgi:hypothetical protein